MFGADDDDDVDAAAAPALRSCFFRPSLPLASFFVVLLSATKKAEIYCQRKSGRKKIKRTVIRRTGERISLQ